MARITVEDCLQVVPSRFDLIIMASKRARQLTTTSRDPLVEWDNDKPTLVALRDIEAGLLDKETLDITLKSLLIFVFVYFLEQIRWSSYCAACHTI